MILGNTSRIFAVDLCGSKLPPRSGRESFHDFNDGLGSDAFCFGLDFTAGFSDGREGISRLEAIGFRSISKLPPRTGRASFHDLGGDLRTLSFSTGFLLRGLICAGGDCIYSLVYAPGILEGAGIDGLLIIISFRIAIGNG